jgi:hypothetical protein
MQKEKDKGFEAYPRPSSADEQFKHQDEYATQKPNEQSPVSDVATKRNEDEGVDTKDQEREP